MTENERRAILERRASWAVHYAGGLSLGSDQVGRVAVELMRQDAKLAQEKPTSRANKSELTPV